MSYFAAAGLPHGRMQARGIDHHAEFLKIMRVAELMQRKGLLDRGRLAHHVDRTVDRFLGQLQRKGRFCRDLLAPASARRTTAPRAARRG